MPTTVVVALGGNALGSNAKEQLANARTAAAAVADLVEAGYRVVIAHGNGPQVGLIKKSFDTSGEPMPLAECNAMCQGYIGYHLQQTLQAELKIRKIQKSVVTVITQVVVDKKDVAFQNPTKPIGAHYSEQTARKKMAESGLLYAEDAGRGWRWVVPSPKPVDICEKETIKLLLDNNWIVIACGGGGIPVVSEGGFLHGIDAVIDKDYAAAKLAELIGADFLFILTAVDRVSLHYRKSNEKALKQMTIPEAEEYIKQGHFAPGSMLPKVEAGVLFARSSSGRKAIIGSLEKASDALAGRSGTIITSM
jgi:carbamate kinase